MTVEQAKEILEKWKYRGSDGLTDERLGYIEGWYHKKDDVAFEMAIKFLEMWDKIKEELEKEMNEYENVLSDLSYSDGVGYAWAVIDEHLKEI